MTYYQRSSSDWNAGIIIGNVDLEHCALRNTSRAHLVGLKFTGPSALDIGLRCSAHRFQSTCRYGKACTYGQMAEIELCSRHKV